MCECECVCVCVLGGREFTVGQSEMKFTMKVSAALSASSLTMLRGAPQLHIVQPARGAARLACKAAAIYIVLFARTKVERGATKMRLIIQPEGRGEEGSSREEYH